MSNKVRFNSNNKSNTNKIKLILIIIIAILVLYVIIKSAINAYKSVDPNESNNDIQYNYQDYSSYDDIWKKYNIKYLNRKDTTDKLTLWVNFDIDLYTGETSNQTYFMNLAKSLASFIDYKNFELIDEKRNIDIEVFCEEPNIIGFVVNGDSNYFQNKESEINARKNRVEITSFSIQSDILNSLNENEWSEKKIDFGSQESTCNGYKIFFDEGIKYKVVSRNIFNIIFTKNYSGLVAGGLNPTATKNQVISALGEPTFNNENVYGYKGEHNYLFFDFINNQISCYPVINITEEEENSIKEYINNMNDTRDVKEFATQLTRLWFDYDVYDYDSNYVDLRYTLKGINLNISSSSLENGIYIYQNYSGDRNIVDLDGVYLKNSDFVYDAELKRAQDERLNRLVEVEDDEEENDVAFLLNAQSYNDGNYIGLQFYSVDEQYPDSELNRLVEVSSYKWFDKYNFVYSVNNDGIYVYNCINRENDKLESIDGNIIIDSINASEIIYNGNQVLNININ